MSQLRVPAARPERREGGRHGRPGTRSLSSAGRSSAARQARQGRQGRQGRPGRSAGRSGKPQGPSPDAPVRAQLLRTAVLPAVVSTLSGVVAVVLTLRSTAAAPGAGVWAALAGIALLALAAVAAAALGAERVARSVAARCDALRLSSAQGQSDLSAVIDKLSRGEQLATPGGAPVAVPGGDEFGLLAQELTRSQDGAVAAVVQASRLSSSVGNEQKVEVFVNLARRLQSLVHREIQLLDELENHVEDPDVLKALFHVDQLATRIRRHAENLAVLGGAVSRRQWSRPVTMTEVLRSAIAEVEQYPRVKLVPPIDGTLRGHVVADVIHLVAELVENATLFSSPHTQVLLRAQHVTAGLAVEVEDRGLGMPADEQKRMNGLLTDPDQVNVAHLLQDGRIGLFVVSALARRHGIRVRLQSNIYGGVQAVLVLPQALLGAGSPARQDGRPSAPARPAPEARPVEQQSGHPRNRPPAHAAPPPSPPPPAPPGHFPQGASPAHPQVPRSPAPAPPLPVRGEPGARPTPAAAAPGAGSAPRGETSAADQARRAAMLGDSMARSALSRPQLPKRRGQEHMVPQLREMPAARPPEEEPVLHDPGLMAAFRRGIGLAESQEGPEAGRPGGPEPAVTAGPAGPPPQDPAPDQPEPQPHETTSKEQTHHGE